MNKEKFGKQFYISSLVVALIVFVVGKIIFSKDLLTNDFNVRYSNLINFSVFGFILPIGVIVREFLLLPYIKKIMIGKIVISSIVLVVGLFLFFMVPTISISTLILYLAYGSLILILVPSNAFRKFDK